MDRVALALGGVELGIGDDLVAHVAVLRVDRTARGGVEIVGIVVDVLEPPGVGGFLVDDRREGVHDEAAERLGLTSGAEREL